MALPSTTLAAALEAVRRTTAAQASAISALEHAFDADTAQLANDRRALEDDRAAFVKDAEDKVSRDEELEQRIKAAAPPPDDVVKLNVGGARFEISRAVLTRVEDSMLGRMFGRCDAMLQPDPVDGSIFIDRDGERFGMLLDFLRGDPPDGPRTQRVIRALPEAAREAAVQELDYFGLEASVFGARPWTDGAAFRVGPEMSRPHTYCAAVFAGGRVVVAGGLSLPSIPTESLDAQTMTFTAGPDLLTGRAGCAGVCIDADRVLVVGGSDGEANLLTSTEILNLSTNTFAPGPNLLFGRNICAAVSLDARRVLVVGGVDDGSILSTTEILTLDTMAFAPGPAMATGRMGCAAISLDEFRVMVIGGRSGLGNLETTEILDVRTMAFAPGPSMTSARTHCATVAVDEKHLLVMGGWGPSSQALASTEIFDIQTMDFAPGPQMRSARGGLAAAHFYVSAERRIVAIGGFDGRSYISTTEVLRLGPDDAD